MPEGPTLVLLKEELKPFAGKKVLKARGYGKIKKSSLANQKIIAVKTWGKHLLICFRDRTLVIHLMLFGFYSINKKAITKANPKLHLHFSKGDLYFYMVNVKLIEGDLDEIYDWTADVMGDAWSVGATRQKLLNMPKAKVCDALVEQETFAGSGNIIKNEVMFRVRVHPLSTIGALPPKKLTELIREVRKYSFDFLKWKRAGTLSKHWQVYEQETCPRCQIPLHKKYLGKSKRQTYYCENCQEKYRMSNVK